MKRIAIVGNPNSGKTTVFNTLSGRNDRVGNWAGVTVEKREAPLRKKYNLSNEDISLIDLPGAYGMEAYTNDELEATQFIKNERIDAIINVIDASNLERSLSFTMELIDTGIPVVVALNKADITKRKKTKIDIEQLSNLLDVDIHFTQATCKKGLHYIIESALNKSGAITCKQMKGHNYGKQRQKKRHQRHYVESRN